MWWKFIPNILQKLSLERNAVCSHIHHIFSAQNNKWLDGLYIECSIYGRHIVYLKRLQRHFEEIRQWGTHWRWKRKVKIKMCENNYLSYWDSDVPEQQKCFVQMSDFDISGKVSSTLKVWTFKKENINGLHNRQTYNNPFQNLICKELNCSQSHNRISKAPWCSLNDFR